MVAPRLTFVAIHALLDDHPVTIIGDDEAVEIEIETILHGCAVHLGDQAACLRQPGAVQPGAVADRHQFVRRLARLRPASTADMQAEFFRKRLQPTFQRAEHAGRDAGGMPVHAHDGAEGLEPEGMGKPAQKLVTPVVVDDSLGNQRTERGHAVAQPWRHAPSVKGEVGAACSLRHASSFCLQSAAIDWITRWHSYPSKSGRWQ